MNKIKPGLCLLLILLLIYLPRVLLPLNPDTVRFHGDEAIGSKNAQITFTRGINEGRWKLLGSENGTLNRFPALWYYLQGSVIYFLGPSLFSIKFFSLVTDFGIAILLYLITKNYFGKKTAIATTFLYSTLPISIHFSLTGYQNIQSTFFLLLTFFVLIRAKRPKQIKKTNLLFLIAGITAGLGMYFYLSSSLIPVLSFAFLFYWYKKQKKTLIKNTLLFLLGFVLTAGPFFYHSFTEYNFLTGRSSVFSLATDQATSFTEIAMNQMSRFFEGFYTGIMNGSGMHYVNLPLFSNPLIFLLFLLGFSYALFKWKKNGHFEFLIIFCCTSLAGGLLTEAPPAPQRLIHLFPLSVVFVVLGINLLLKPFKKRNFFYIPIIFLLFSFNLFSFITQNIPQNKKIPKPEYSFCQYYSQHDYDHFVYTHIPIHMLPRIYFYSNGQIDPQPVRSSSDLLSATKLFLFLTDEEGIKLLTESPALEFTKLNWNHQDKYPVKYQLFLVNDPL